MERGRARVRQNWARAHFSRTTPRDPPACTQRALLRAVLQHRAKPTLAAILSAAETPPAPLHLPPAPAMKVPLAGPDAAGCATETILSEVGVVLLRQFDMREACVLRLVCREFVEAVRVQQWEDGATVIQGSIAAWRRCFPRARCANVGNNLRSAIYRRVPMVDADFEHLASLRELNLSGCKGITDAAFAHLRGIRSLDIMGCRGITGAGFVHLRGIHTLEMSCCWGITDAAFAHLRGIHTLNMSYCRGITDAAFAHLRGIHTLGAAYCAGITGAGFVHLAGIQRLNIQGCTSITADAAFVHLCSVSSEVRMIGCSADAIAAARRAGVPVWPPE
jgi:hypothetical protein